MVHLGNEEAIVKFQALPALYLDLVHPLLVFEHGLLALAQRSGQARIELLLLPPHLFLLLTQRLFHSLASEVLQILQLFIELRVGALELSWVSNAKKCFQISSKISGTWSKIAVSFTSWDCFCGILI